MSKALHNWAGNLRYSTARLHAPASAEALCETVARLERLRVIGARHSFNRIADSDANLVSLENLDRVVAIDVSARRVTIEAGITYGRLCEQLHRAGWALHNLASLPHINVAGACATATHGSGERLGNLATAVLAIEFVNAAGELVVLSRETDPAVFPGAVVHLGGLGVVVRLTLEIQPTFEVRQNVYEGLPLDALADNWDAITGAATSVSLFTDWRDASFTQVWLKQRMDDAFGVDPPGDFFGAKPAVGARHPIAGVDPIHCTPQQGVPGPWFDRLPHFRMDFTPSAGKELQTEYLVPREHALDALHRVAALRERITPLLLISEIRVIHADDLWMSPCYRKPCIGIHFTWRPDWPGVGALLPTIEDALSPCDIRPHWGKLFTMPGAQIQTRYERIDEFRSLAQKHDPAGKFRNAFLDDVVFGGE